MVRLTCLLLIGFFTLAVDLAPVRSQETIIQPLTTITPITCYIITGRKGSYKDFCGSGANALEAEDCARQKMYAEGYTERFGGLDENCQEDVCQGDVSCPNFTRMAYSNCPQPKVTVNLNCIACDGACISATADGTTWCEAYQKAQNTAKRVAQYEGHGAIRCCRVVQEPVIQCAPAARRHFLPLLRRR